MRSYGSQTGFSLVEMLIVVVILSVVAAVAIPNFYSCYERVLLEKTVHDIGLTMRYAQHQAVTKGREHRFEFQADYSAYKVSVRTEIDGREEYLPFAGKVGTGRIPEGVSIKATKSMLAFKPDGRIEQGEFMVCLSSDCYEISSKKRSGYVSVTRAER